MVRSCPGDLGIPFYCPGSCREAGPIWLIHPQQLISPLRFQRELGCISEVLLHGLSMALITAWNKEVTKAWIQSHPCNHSWSIAPSTTHGLWGSQKRIKTHLEHECYGCRFASRPIQVLVIIFKALHGMKPSYFILKELSQLIWPVPPSQTGKLCYRPC